MDGAAVPDRCWKEQEMWAEREKGEHLWVTNRHLATGWQKLIKARASTSCDISVTVAVFLKWLLMCACFEAAELRFSFYQTLSRHVSWSLKITVMQLNEKWLQRMGSMCLYALKSPCWTSLSRWDASVWVREASLELDDGNDAVSSLKLRGILLVQAAKSRTQQCLTLTAHHYYCDPTLTPKGCWGNYYFWINAYVFHNITTLSQWHLERRYLAFFKPCFLLNAAKMCWETISKTNWIHRGSWLTLKDTYLSFTF